MGFTTDLGAYEDFSACNGLFSEINRKTYLKLITIEECMKNSNEHVKLKTTKFALE